ncbi:MAG: pyridoxal phosphate-dependent aminotransferase [Saprospiraceae bacterium]|nr:pyridoxal phosphate-dependent aminotransferase [Saprospiraceae bacterium]MBK8295822.1 pyridoxal phosphate-dependent aminotransferase [Saprospiraceae bacterium]
MFKIAQRAQLMTESATLKMAQLARQMTAQGHDVINLSLGEPDFDTPEHIKQAAIQAIRDGYTKYTPVAGTLELRQAISKKFKKDNQLHYSPEEIIVSNGAKQCFANLCFALLEAGDEVVLFSPYWVSYYEIIKLAGATPVCVFADVDKDFKPSAQQLRDAISSRTRMFVFSSPCNPTGTVFSKEDMQLYADVLRDYPEILIVSDEIYEYIQFGSQHMSIGSLPDMNQRTATINGFSKGFSMTGWRLGYMGGPSDVINACIKIQGQFTSGAASFSQKAACLALESDLKPTYDMCQAFEKRRNRLLEEIKLLPEWQVNKPQGAFYVLPNVKSCFGKKYDTGIIENSDDLAIYLLQEAKVAVVNGIAFGAPDCLRISYSLSEERIVESIKRIRVALDKLV